MPSNFSSPIYNVTLENGKKVEVDVTNSISAGLGPNDGMLSHLVPWMKQRGYSRVLDFGAGALRHTIPLLRKGIEVIAVEYERAFARPRAAKTLTAARKFDGFTALVWPEDFLKSKVRYDVALLLYVLQVVPIKTERHLILRSIGDRFRRDGPRRLYYASRYGEAPLLPQNTRYNDGWIRGKGDRDHSFYTEWNANDTNTLFAKAGYSRAGSYDGATQPYIYDLKPGIL